MLIKKKVCLLGATAVGKTSLFNRLLKRDFDPTYATTIGIVTDEISRQIEGVEVVLDLWDTEGKDEFNNPNPEFLDGSSGYFLVIDGTRRDTLDEANELRKFGRSILGETVPFVFLVNKHDLLDQWTIEEQDLTNIKNKNWPIVLTSASTGEAVELAVELLIRRMVDMSV